MPSSNYIKMRLNTIPAEVMYVERSSVQLDGGLIIIHLPSVSSLALTFPSFDCCLNQVSTVVLEGSRINDLLSHSEVSVTLGIISR